MHRFTILFLALAAAIAAPDSRPARAAARAAVETAPAAAPAARRGGPRLWRIAGPVARVRDGDTIVVGGKALRLWGVHAPERHEAGCPAAKRWMVELVADQVVVCDLVGGRSHDRWVAVCRIGERDLAALLIGAGLGRDCPRFSRGHYAGRETGVGRALPLPSYCEPR
jgi:endonuclease YncB( thermonuclease family)